MAKGKHKSSKGALIKGMSRNLPSAIFEDPYFRNELKKLMKGYAGVYALYKEKSLYYVGLSVHLRGRIEGHLKDRHRGKWDYFKIFRIKKFQYLKDIETLIQNIIKLPGNRAKGKVPRDADMTHALRVVMREYERRIKPLKRALR